MENDATFCAICGQIAQGDPNATANAAARVTNNKSNPNTKPRK